MSASARTSATARHPALNRMPRDFLERGFTAPFTSRCILTGDAR